MARNRLNPWPSVADLFSALTVVAFAGLIVVTVDAVVLTANERQERDAAQELATDFKRQYRPMPGESVEVHPCRDRQADECIEIPFRFKPGVSDLEPSGIEQVNQACQIYVSTVEVVIHDLQARHYRFEKPNFVLIIEGNTDATIPPQIKGGRQRFMYNWSLSSTRAANVVYEFNKCGVSSATGYRVTSVGLAATRRLCTEPHPDSKCHEQNRRTTMRIRVERDEEVARPNS
jgi:outer membrane protein OmpA-like peptidoglycan-associated protein